MGGSRILDGGHVLTSGLSVGGLGGEGEHGTVTPLDPPILGYRSDKNYALLSKVLQFTILLQAIDTEKETV